MTWNDAALISRVEVEVHRTDEGCRGDQRCCVVKAVRVSTEKFDKQNSLSAIIDKC
jgi:hypothetical protein